MKTPFLAFVLTLFCFGSALAQNNTSTSTTKSSASKSELIKEDATQNSSAYKATVARKMKTAERLDKDYQRPVIEMTDEYIDGQIAEIQKVIDKNEDNVNFNRSGYEKRIKYLESRRPKK
ncbi:MAG: hypothetical protein ACPGU4_01725 [Flavobacteriales bacterium]